MTYDELLKEADRAGIITKEKALVSSEGRIQGKRIAINKRLTETQKACALSEELGHYYTTVGGILDLTSSQNRRQERQARLWAYNKQIGLTGIIRAYEHRCRNQYELADFLEVTEEFLQEALDCYREKYGNYACVDNYVISFVPNLSVCKMI